MLSKLTCYSPQKCPCALQDMLEHLTHDQLSTTYCYTVTFMLQPSKMQKKPEIAKFGVFRASCAIVQTARAGSAWRVYTSASRNSISGQKFWLGARISGRNFGLETEILAWPEISACRCIAPNCPLLIETRGDFYASTLKNARGSQKSQKQAFWRAWRTIVRTARAVSAWKSDQLSTTYFYT